MKKSNIINYIGKSLAVFSLISGISGCYENHNEEYYKPKEPISSRVEKLDYFKKYKIGEIYDTGVAPTNDITVKFADMNNDGNLDMIVINKFGEVMLYLNKGLLQDKK